MWPILTTLPSGYRLATYQAIIIRLHSPIYTAGVTVRFEYGFGLSLFTILTRLFIGVKCQPLSCSPDPKSSYNAHSSTSHFYYLLMSSRSSLPAKAKVRYSNYLFLTKRWLESVLYTQYCTVPVLIFEAYGNVHSTCVWIRSAILLDSVHEEAVSISLVTWEPENKSSSCGLVLAEFEFVWGILCW